MAISGMSPAVLTEAVWALAQKGIIPDRIVVLTTGTGKRKILNELLCADGPWEKLRTVLVAQGHNINDKLVFTEHSIKTFVDDKDREVEDLTTEALNLYAANEMIRTFREFTENSDCQVHALLAGGRKTMSALFFSSMCLMGRQGDHIYHVLVSDGYENPRLSPLFYFPQAGVQHTYLKGTETITLQSTDCVVNLFDVPFVPMGSWAEQKCKAFRRGFSYEQLIRAVNTELEGDVFPQIEIDMADKGTVKIDGKAIQLSPNEFALFVLMVQGRCAEKCLPLLREAKDYLCLGDEIEEQDYEAWRWIEKFMGDETKDKRMGRFANYGLEQHERDNKMDRDLSHVLSQLRKKLPDMPCFKRLICRDSFPDDFDFSRIIWYHIDVVKRELAEKFLGEAVLKLGKWSK